MGDNSVVPMTFTVRARVPRALPTSIGYKDMHRLACFLLEDAGMEAHESQSKPFSAWPLLTDDENPRGVEITLHSLVDDESLIERVQVRLKGQYGRVPNLGRDLPLVEPDLTVEMESWDDLGTAVGRENADVRLMAPMSYSRSGIHYPLPDPILVHRQLETRWNEFAPSHLAIEDDLSREVNAAISLSHVSIESVALREYHGRLAGLGEFGFRVAASAEPIVKEWFASLWSFARYAGLGAMTAHGLGAVTVDLH